MAKLVYANVENHPHEANASTVFLYFEGVPTAEEVREGFEAEVCDSLGLNVDTEDRFYEHEVVPNVVSERAGLTRVVGFPAG